MPGWHSSLEEGSGELPGWHSSLEEGSGKLPGRHSSLEEGSGELPGRGLLTRGLPPTLATAAVKHGIHVPFANAAALAPPGV